MAVTAVRQGIVTLHEDHVDMVGYVVAARTGNNEINHNNNNNNNNFNLKQQQQHQHQHQHST